MKRSAFIIVGIGLLAAMAAFARPIRSLVGEKGEDYVDVSAPTASDYVNDGLVFMLDGIENVDWGVHDNTAQEWVDLVGGTTPRQYQQIGYFTDKAFNTNSYYDDTGKTFNCLYLPDILYQTAATKQFTVEMGGIIRKSKSTGLTVLELCGNLVWGWGYYGSQSYNQRNSLRYQKLYGSIVNRATWALLPIDGTEDILFTNASSFNTSFVDCFSGIADMTYRWNLQTDEATQTQPKMGYLGCNLTIYYLRIYNRPLSLSEMKHNYSIDKARFGLGQ